MASIRYKMVNQLPLTLSSRMRQSIHLNSYQAQPLQAKGHAYRLGAWQDCIGNIITLMVLVQKLWVQLAVRSVLLKLSQHLSLLQLKYPCYNPFKDHKSETDIFSKWFENCINSTQKYLNYIIHCLIPESHHLFTA